MNLIASQGTMRIESDGPSFSVAPTRPLLREVGFTKASVEEQFLPLSDHP